MALKIGMLPAITPGPIAQRSPVLAEINGAGLVAWLRHWLMMRQALDFVHHRRQFRQRPAAWPGMETRGSAVDFLPERDLATPGSNAAIPPRHHHSRPIRADVTF